jgi:hypothetical protein
LSLINAIIKTGATWAPTGGTDVTFVPDGKTVQDGISLVVAADTNLLTRRSLTARAVLPALPAKTGDFAKLGRNSLVYKVPFVAADGKLYLQTVRIEMAFHAEYTGKNTVINDATAFIADSDFANFWQSSLTS